jgi:hypothetical protein
MRAINRPPHDYGVVFGICIDSIRSQGLRERLHAIAVPLSETAAEYDRRAALAELHTFPVHRGENTDIAMGNVSKEELKNVYSEHMVAKGKPARDIYQAILSLAPMGLCPLCGFNQAETLDHYLSKANYPQFSVLPLNLVPACWGCNHGKRDTVAQTAGQQPLHPYYDHGHYISDQWLFAEVQQTSPVTVRYYVNPPAAWNPIFKERVEHHFTGFGLSRKYSVQAIGELSAIRYVLAHFCQDEVSRKIRLSEAATTHYNLHRNSWQTALYQALENSAWYCQVGFNSE